MILQALARYYEDLLSRGEIDAPGWTPAKISYALCLNEKGRLTQVVPTMEEVSKGKKTVLQPQVFPLPAAVKRTVGIDSNFLWDNSTYLLGVDQKGKPERSRDCFAAAAQKHHAVLDDIDSSIARAILAFFDTWQPSQAAEHSALAGLLEEVTAGANLLFRVDGCYPQKDVAIREAWQSYRESSNPDAVRMQCLVTGREDEITATHPAIKGVRDAQSSGAALVSFNAPAFCSYGREQNFNAPVGKYAAFAYTAALNHLLADRNNVQLIGDTTVVCWAEGADPAYQSFAMTAFFGAESGLSDNDLRAALKQLADGLPCDDLGIDPERPFYILGLAPNAARLSVRFFLRDSFGRLMKNVNDHYERVKIINARYEVVPLWALLRETVNLNSRDKSPSPAMTGAVARAIFSGGPYPASLLEAVMLRIRAERNITWGRAAIIKAYYLKNPHKDCPKEVLTVSLNEASTDTAYTLGRLFSVYEAVQQTANPGINATIKDKYFNSAAAMPASIFPILNNLCQKHLRKLDGRLRVYYDKQIMELKGRLGESYPPRMTLAQQGSFDLGYYHQTQKRYTKKEEEKNV
ncbi:MAG: type I-C CRISPR-associated protein Cas8c/Csd1 [Clostridiales bacterium]|nr:type I-C CRISPR-associated protein Cas8c/Csd1 [Clostridiales bacterium]